MWIISAKNFMDHYWYASFSYIIAQEWLCMMVPVAKNLIMEKYLFGRLEYEYVCQKSPFTYCHHDITIPR